MIPCTKSAFAVIGKECSTREGEGCIQRAWEQANAGFPEIAGLAVRDPQGNVAGVWGAMTDFSRSFQPWEDRFTQGLYLAGVECREDAQPPEGWTKWVIPGFEYRAVEQGDGAFQKALRQLEEQGLALAGAVQEYTCPATGKSYLYFPIRRL